MSPLGTLGLLAAFGLLVCAWVLILTAILKRSAGRSWLFGRIGFYAASSLLFWCSALLLVALLLNEFSLSYVATFSSLSTPWYDRVTAFWAGCEGALLLWLMLIVSFGTLLLISIVRSRTNEDPRVQQYLTLTFVTISAVFLGVILCWANPFSADIVSVDDGMGLAGEFRDWSVRIRPAVLFAGYAALAMVFALAVSGGAEALRESLVARWTRIAWVLLGGGIGLGAVGGYDQTGLGGLFSGWDKVNNASVVPWLIATAMIHSAPGRSLSFRRVILLAGAGFAGTLWAGYITSSRPIDLAFTPIFVAMTAGIAAVLALTFYRARLEPGPMNPDDPTSRIAVGVFLLLGLAILLATPCCGAGDEACELRMAIVSRYLVGGSAVAMLIVLLWCSLRGVSNVRRVVLECGLSSATVASVVCFCLWYLGQFSGGRLLGSWLATAVAGTVVFEYCYFYIPYRQQRRGSGTRLLAHLAVALLSLGVVLQPTDPNVHGWRTWPVGLIWLGLGLLILAGVVTARRFSIEREIVDSQETIDD